MSFNKITTSILSDRWNACDELTEWLSKYFLGGGYLHEVSLRLKTYDCGWDKWLWRHCCNDKDYVNQTIVTSDKKEGHLVLGNYDYLVVGDGGHVTTNDHGTSITGDNGTAISGYSGHSIAGDNGIAISGNFGVAIAGTCGEASVGRGYRAVVGLGGKVAGGEGSELHILHHVVNDNYEGILSKNSSYKIMTAIVWENGIKSDTFYKLDNEGKFVNEWL